MREQGFSYYTPSGFSVGGNITNTVHPVTLLTGSEHPRAGFAVSSMNFTGNQPWNGVVVWAFSNTLVARGSPGLIITGKYVPTANNYTLPAAANQPGAPNSIDTGDSRISGTPVYHAGVISASFTTAGFDGHSHVLWFQVRPQLNDNDARCTGTYLNKCPQIIDAQLLNEDCYFCGGAGVNGSTYFGTLAPNIGGDLTMVFNYSDDNNFPGTAYVSRRVTQQLNTMHDAGIWLCGGSGKYSQDRWGDYTAAVGDITSLTTNYMWFSGMNSDASGNWQTCIGENGFTAVNQP
jgi:hypothetical protein